MSARALPLSAARPAQLRPFNMGRDLSAVADLVELCFQDTLDEDGRMYIRQMRRTANSNNLLNAAISATLNNDMPPGGFIWEEAGRLVGNLSLVPINALGRRYYLIANVAVHPDYRRRGIASQLTEAALERALASRVDQIWLQVDHNNAAAIQLYRQMGFGEQAHRIGWAFRPSGQLAQLPGPKLHIRKATSADWSAQKSWLKASYPAEVRWNLPLDLRHLQPGLMGSVQRLLGDRRVLQWAAESEGRLLGILSWQSSMLNADRLWLACAPENEALALPSLLSQAHEHLRRGRKVLLNYPAGRGEAIFEAQGFTRMRQLIWMRYSG